MDTRYSAERLPAVSNTTGEQGRRTRGHRFALNAWVLAGILSLGTAQAVIIDIDVGGTVVNTSGFLDGPLAVGESFSGTFSYDDAVPDDNPDPAAGGYFGGLTGLALNLSGGATFDSTFGVVLTASDFSGSSWNSLGLTNTSFPLPVSTFANFSILYAGPTGLFPNDGINQPSLNDPSLFDSTQIQIEVFAPGGDAGVVIGAATLNIAGTPDERR